MTDQKQLTQWATVREVADALRLSSEEVRRRARTGELAAFKDGSRTMFRREDIEKITGRWMQASA